MKDAHLRVDDDALSINNNDHLHLEKVELFTGDDDYNETDLLEAHVHRPTTKLVIKKTLSDVLKPSPYRLRGEPGIRAHIKSEDGRTYVLTLAHHKGNILVSAKEILV